MKKVVTLIIISIFALVIAQQPLALSTTIYHHETATIGAWGPDTYSQCVHLHAWESDDAFVAVGMAAIYDQVYYAYYDEYAYWDTSWTFRAGYGSMMPNMPAPNWRFSDVPICAYMYDYQTYGEFNSRGIPYQVYNSWVIDDNYYQSFWVQTLVWGRSYGVFYDSNDPDHVVYLSAEPSGNNFDIMTAQPGPPVPYDNTYEEYQW